MRMSTSFTSCPCVVLGHLSIKCWTIVTLQCAYGIQIRHTLVCWNPLLIVNEKHVEIDQSRNSEYFLCLESALKVTVLAQSTTLFWFRHCVLLHVLEQNVRYELPGLTSEITKNMFPELQTDVCKWSTLKDTYIHTYCGSWSVCKSWVLWVLNSLQNATPN